MTMDVMTKDGIKIYCLPDTAKCKWEDRNPLFIRSCPLYNFDYKGDICVPELCDEYTEE